jgi:transposase
MCALFNGLSDVRVCGTLAVRSFGRILAHCTEMIVAWHCSPLSNRPTEAANDLIERVKRVAFGFGGFANYRVRALLYAGKPDWSLIETVTPL